MRWRSSSSQPQQGESSEEPGHIHDTVRASSSADNDDSDQNFSTVQTQSQIQSHDDNSNSRYDDDEGTKGYVVLIPELNKVVVSADVTFMDEGTSRTGRLPNVQDL